MSGKGVVALYAEVPFDLRRALQKRSFDTGIKQRRLVEAALRAFLDMPSTGEGQEQM